MQFPQLLPDRKVISLACSQANYLGEIQFSFLLPSLPLDYFDVQDLKILLGIISFNVIVASSRHYGLKCIFCRTLDRI